MKTFRAFVMALAVAALQGCLSGPDFKTYEASAPPPQHNNARIWFYSPRNTGAIAVAPVYLNNVLIAIGRNGGCFYCDRPAGRYEVQCGKQKTDIAYLMLTNNQVQYISLRPVSGIPGITADHLLPEVVTADEAALDITECRHYEKKPKK
jgi:hypothetical protein